LAENFYFLEYLMFLSPIVYYKTDSQYLPKVFAFYSQNQLPIYKNQYTICLKYKPNFKFRQVFSFKQIQIRVPAKDQILIHFIIVDLS